MTLRSELANRCLLLGPGQSVEMFFAAIVQWLLELEAACELSADRGGAVFR
jgi:hypothetical protein